MFEIHARAESHGATKFQFQYEQLAANNGQCTADPREFSSKMNLRLRVGNIFECASILTTDTDIYIYIQYRGGGLIQIYMYILFIYNDM